ncbi:uncharacterized protein EAF02_001850 [Botrytis sinoallii]|uniref:uncharacterized protein n=1 Tax=Botrytis sinoallii TaxID=1463999 RepID=UPI0018FFC17D|nr:uncharacterized protein EAF02_001850 [Botrytis sinoallii]KAF7891525.1 hypothetical protein EAF02_001850 [Botrytis sinoallii]
MSAQTFIENHILMDVEAQSPLPTGGHKMLSREEWLKLKPIILQLYIDEEQKYPTVARELARRFEFYPTRRQFTRKTEEWGLRKNFRKAERKLLLQNDKKGDIAEFFDGDKRVSDPKRIQRLKKRYAHENPCSQVQLVPSYQDINIPPKSVGPYRPPGEQPPISNYVNEIALAHVESTISNVTENNDAMDLEQWPLSWDIDVPGSPGLTRLFRLLDIEASMPPLNLDDEVVDKKETISGNELRNNVESHGTTSKQLSTLCSRVKYAYIPNVVIQPVPTPVKRIPWSPLFELEIFPTSRSTRGYDSGMTIASVSSPLIEVWKREIEDWELKLRKLRKILPDHNPAIILSLENLIHLNEQSRGRCLSLHLQLLAARLKESCPNNHRIMEVYLEIVMGLLLKGKVSDATYLSRSLRGAIQQSQLSSGHPFYIRLSYLEAYILYIDGQDAEAELIIRSVIQNLLNNQNLDRNHKMTSAALVLLACLIEEKNEDAFSEIEKLHRYNIHQAIKHGRSLSNTYFDSVSHLIYVLLEGQKIEEAHSLCIYIMECVELTLGKRHLWYYEYQEHLGFILFGRGMISESIDVFHNILLEVDDCHFRAGTYYNLGYILEKYGNFREAIVSYKRCLLNEVQEESWESWMDSKITCERLGHCYEELSQFKDALFLYENTLEKVKRIIGGDHSFIKKVEGWISEVQERIEESSSVGEELSAPRQFQMGEVDDLGYGQFGEKIVDDVSLREIFEIEDKELDEEIADISKQISSMKLS